MGLSMNQSMWLDISIFIVILNLVAVVIEIGFLEKINSTRARCRLSSSNILILAGNTVSPEVFLGQKFSGLYIYFCYCPCKS